MYRFELTVLADGPTADGYTYRANSLCAAEHGGTHLDAPAHFSAHGQTAEAIPAERLVGPGVVIDVAERCAEDPDCAVGVADVLAFESRHGRIPEGLIVLLRTSANAGRTARPTSGRPSAAPGPSPSCAYFEAHRVLAERNVPILENVASLGELPATSFTVVALPMKIGGGSGGPLRIVAILAPGR